VRELSRTLPFQVLVVTHCKSVADCADWAVCIHKGGLFHQQQTGKLQRPEQHQWREDE
jgi:DNA repair ATPase RecN